jgi:hypothetical protein
MAFERLDLSGVYEVGEGGSVALPLLGRVNLTGQTLVCAEAVIARNVEQIDPSVSAVTASYSSRLPVTVKGAVRAPGAYNYAFGMTVDRLLSLAGATFSDSPITPEEFEALLAQRDELQRREITATLAKRRLEAVLAERSELDLSDTIVEDTPLDTVGPLISAESAALSEELALNRMSDERRSVEIEGLLRELADIESQLALATEQLKDLQSRQEEVMLLKSKGLIQVSQLDTLISNVMELHRIQMQLTSERSSLKSQIALSREDARLDIQRRKQGLAQRISELSGEISLLGLQRQAIESRLSSLGPGEPGTDRELPLVVSIRRTEATESYRLAADLQTMLFPGDIVSVSLPPTALGPKVTASSSAQDGGEAIPRETGKQ